MSPAPRVDFLGSILSRKRAEVADRQRQVPLEQLLAAPRGRPVPSFHGALSRRGQSPRVIAEVKRRSPSAGVLADLDAEVIGRRYAQAGAAAISVLTDGPGFGGDLEDLRVVSAAVRTPTLRKDFLVDRYQVEEARAAGASAVLLIVAALTPPQLEGLLRSAQEAGLDALVEVHDRAELEVALAAGAKIIGINNRNLRTFVVDLQTSVALLPSIPDDRLAVVESGVRDLEDVRRLRDAGAANFLIGEALVRAADPGALVEAIGALR
ncbi:MAG: indole-3-glycerol phosphate synthase TrpC [Myxococcota bacterium]|nr:indole-3-glycerol phosphate synthase TrpC [Myxococcota bacterium]